jgi:hypothetical protein
MPSIPSAAYWDDYSCTTAVWETQADRASIQGTPMRNFFRRQWHWFRRFALLSILVGLAGCEEKPKPAERAYVTMTGHNYTEDYIHQFYVEGAWGGNVRAYGGGGKFTCCVGVPRYWRPGLTATVRWTTSSSIPGTHSGETWHEEIVAIDPYEKAGGSMNTHFFPDNKVRLIVSEMGPSAEKYPGPPPPEKPADWPYGRYEWPKP